MRLTRQALRGDWPISTRVKQLAMTAVVDILDPTTHRGTLANNRTVLAAVRTLAAFSGLTLKQAAIDLRREKQEGKQSEVSLADLVGEAETRAEMRKHERDNP
jgi:uncharacterized membrane protein YidH (DUF202 family)